METGHNKVLCEDIDLINLAQIGFGGGYLWAR
jgi:hypothetical protein